MADWIPGALASAPSGSKENSASPVKATPRSMKNPNSPWADLTEKTYEDPKLREKYERNRERAMQRRKAEKEGGAS